MIQKLKDYGIELFFIELDRDGYYAPDLKTIFVNQDLTDEEAKKVILHELKHALDHHEFSILYKSIYYRMKMERHANDFMLSEILKEYDYEFNYSGIIEEFKLGLGSEDTLRGMR